MTDTNAHIIDGKAFAAALRGRVALAAADFATRAGRPAGLAVVLVGDDPASHVYVASKAKQTVEAGMASFEHRLPADVDEASLLALIDRLNSDDATDGILVQLPLPAHLDSKLIIDSILPNKDVDGFHRYNMGSLALKDPNICPCTPHGVMYMLDSINLEYHGKHAVILGTSNIVGRPMALELINRGATVTMCNSKTRNVVELIGAADIVIAAIGRPNFVQGAWLKPGCIAIDVGINRLDTGKLCGDIEFTSAFERAQYITPVPGGVGPMTIAMLLKNTLHCYKLNTRKEV